MNTRLKRGPEGLRCLLCSALAAVMLVLPQAALAQAADPTAAPETEDTAAPAAAPAAPAAPEPGTQAYKHKLRSLEERVVNLKEKIFRTKTRLLLLKERILNDVIAEARLVVHHLEFDCGSILRELERIHPRHQAAWKDIARHGHIATTYA